jgi:general secretion pathway protein M
MRPATVRQSLFAVLIYAAAVLGVVAWIVMNDGANRELQAQYDAKAQILDGLNRRALSDLGRGKSAGTDLDIATVAAPSETVAASTLQRYLLDRLESAEGVVQSVQAESRRESTEQGLQRLSAQLTFDGPTVALQHVVFDLDTGTPFVFVDSLSVQPAPAVTSGTRAGDRLRVTLAVTSYWKPGEGTGGDR